MINALTVDVEDYFQVSAFASNIDRSSWDQRECRVERNVDRILQLFASSHVKATFFTLGWIAERYPDVVRRIVEQGHELASHGYGHQRASDLSESQLFEDVDRSKKILEDLGGVQVIGYRAPSFSIGKANWWAFGCLERAGYRYSSSVVPIRHDHYGMPTSPRFAYKVSDGMYEIPISTLRVLDHNIPAGGGGFFRLYPYAISRWMIDRVNKVDQQPTVFYFHPWELDQGQPRVLGIGAKSRFRHYLNIHRVEDRLKLLLADFRWARMDKIFSLHSLPRESTVARTLTPHDLRTATAPIRF